MMLIDDVKITVKAGDGGDGSSATKHVYGSKKIVPDGGNGGKGGNVYFQGSSNIFDLSEFKYKKYLKAGDGVDGSHKNLDGAKGKDIYILVPLGTTIKDETTNESIEILTQDPICVAYGGRGGMGNFDYHYILNQPRSRISKGQLGEVKKLHLILNLIADVGLVGLPNAGKSSLLKSLTNANPKVGDYPFTTLQPNLGALGKIILADIPGLISGASKGKGLGLTFLKHIKKTKILLHCIASDDTEIEASYRIVRNEFKEFDKTLHEKKEIIILTKKDLVEEATLKEKISKLKKYAKKVLTVSVYDENSLENLKKEIIASF